DHLPARAAVRRDVHDLAPHVHLRVLVRRDDDGKCPIPSVLHVSGPPTVARLGPDAHVPRMIGPNVVDLEPAVVAARPYRVVVHRVGDPKAAFAPTHVTPLALAQPARHAAARHAVRRAVLAVAVAVVGHARVGVHVIHLRARAHDAGPALAN